MCSLYVTFSPYQGFKCGGDVRITVFKQKKMLEGIADGLILADVCPHPRHPLSSGALTATCLVRRISHSVRLPQAVGGDGEKILGSNDLSKRKIAGKEPGVLFYFLFHTHFLEDDGTVAVPLAMMDKAFKNKKQRYLENGIAVLETETGAGAAAVSQDASSA